MTTRAKEISDLGITSLFTLDDNGNVGIGTDSPTLISSSGTTLDVVGDSGGFVRVERTNETNPSVGKFIASNGAIQIGSETNSAFLFNTNNEERMRITSNGNVGIGTDSPVQKLDVNGAVAVDYVLLRDNTAALALYGGTDALNATGIILDGPDRTSGKDNRIRFITTGFTERMRITSNGDVGIGTDSPSALLHVAGSFRVNSFNIDAQHVVTGNINDYKINGFYRFDPSVSNLPTATYYAVVIYGNNSNVVTQLATRLNTSFTYVRSFNTTWSSWTQI